MPPSGFSVGTGACSGNPARHEGALFMTVISQLFDSSSQSTRIQYFLTLFISFLTVTIIGVVGVIVTGTGVIGTLLSLILIPVWIIAHIRRLHDRGHSGWMVLGFLIPLANLGLLLYLLLAPTATKSGIEEWKPPAGQLRDCPDCGAESPPTNKFCTRCGSAILV